MSSVSRYHVVMEAGAEFDVTADQRDFAAWEVQPFGCSVAESFNRVFTYTRFVAWNAGKRAKLHALTWEQFGEQCISVDRVTEEEGDADTPGEPAATAGA